MRRGLSLALAAALLLSGCGALPRPREMGDMALLRVMGVDRGEGGPAMSAATGPQAPEQPARLWQGEGTSLSAAAQAIQSRSDRYVFFGYVDQLLLGEDQSRRGVEDIFAYVARDAQLSLAARLWIIQDGEAHGALEAGATRGWRAAWPLWPPTGRWACLSGPGGWGRSTPSCWSRGAAMPPP